jgi:DNA ligase (NAD+)
MNRFGSLRELADADIETLLTVPDIGGVTAGTIRSFFDAEENRKLLDELLELGLCMESTDNDRSDELAGRTYVVTGEVTQFRNRAELVEFIEKRGGKCAGSVSKKTYALINNDLTSMSGKNKKAKELGIPILTEEELLKGLEGKDNNADQSTE